MQDNCAVGRPSHRILQSDEAALLTSWRWPTGPAERLQRAEQLERSADLKVFGRLLATIAYNFVLDGLTLIKGSQACPLDGGNVNEHILPAALRLNESVSFGRVEPFHGSCSHHPLLAFSAGQVVGAMPRGACGD